MPLLQSLPPPEPPLAWCGEGIGGRIAMRVVFLTSNERVRGVTSDDGFEIGTFSAATILRWDNQVSSSERPASMRDHWAMGRPFGSPDLRILGVTPGLGPAVG